MVERRAVRWRVFVGAAAAWTLALSASAQVRVVTWNIARLQGDPNAIEEVLATLAEDDRPGFAEAPSILVFQEVTSSSLAGISALVAAGAGGVPYQLATYTSSPSEDSSGGAVALFYRADRLQEVAAQHRDIATGAGRNSDRWSLRLVGYPEPIGSLWIYGSHLKASNDAESRAARLAGANALRADMATLPAGSRIMLVGDLNLYVNTESAYVALLAGGGLLDPLGSGSWAGGSNALKHSQSPRDLSSGGLVGGAMDDRFDFQLVSPALSDGAGLDLIGGTYRSVGNDGAHFDQAINAGNNLYFPGQVARSNALADALFDASDHLPVATDLRLPGVLVAAMSDDLGRAFRGATVPIAVVLSNGAPGANAQRSAPIAVTVEGVEGAVGANSATAPLLPATVTATVLLDCSTAGTLDVVVEARASGEVANAVFPLQAQAEVLEPARPSLEAGAVVEEIEASIKVQPGAPQVVEFLIYNLPAPPPQGVLEVDEVLVAPGPVSLVEAPATVGVLPGVLRVSVDPALVPTKGWQGSIEIEVSDEDLPGARAASLAIQLAVSVADAGDPADLNHDGIVNGADLAILLGAWGGSGPADLNHDGIVNGADLAILLGAWSSG